MLTARLGGNDVFVDIGDKSWGVLACQRLFGSIEGNKTLHVGDQFLHNGMDREPHRDVPAAGRDCRAGRDAPAQDSIKPPVTVDWTQEVLCSIICV
jgi:hypothetical protein